MVPVQAERATPPLLWGRATRRLLMWLEGSMFRLNGSSGVVYLYELISLAKSLFQLFLLVLQDRARVFLPFQFLKPQEQK